jgi:PhnB protein
MQLEPYIFFHGTCEEALTFYAKCLDGKIVGINRFAGSPMEAHAPADWGNKVMHASFTADGFRFMASDGHPGTPPNGEDDIALSLALDDVERARGIFQALAEGGTVTMEFAEAFWGGTFGTLTDRFGIQWMVSAGGPSE